MRPSKSNNHDVKSPSSQPSSLQPSPQKEDNSLLLGSPPIQNPGNTPNPQITPQTQRSDKITPQSRRTEADEFENSQNILDESMGVANNSRLSSKHKKKRPVSSFLPKNLFSFGKTPKKSNPEPKKEPSPIYPLQRPTSAASNASSGSNASFHSSNNPPSSSRSSPADFQARKTNSAPGGDMRSLSARDSPHNVPFDGSTAPKIFELLPWTSETEIFVDKLLSSLNVSKESLLEDQFQAPRQTSELFDAFVSQQKSNVEEMPLYFSIRNFMSQQKFNQIFLPTPSNEDAFLNGTYDPLLKNELKMNLLLNEASSNLEKIWASFADDAKDETSSQTRGNNLGSKKDQQLLNILMQKSSAGTANTLAIVNESDKKQREALDLIQEHILPAPSFPLKLDHIYGYDSVAIRNNVFFVSDSHIFYTAGKMGVFLDINTSLQTFIDAHEDFITCVAFHKPSGIVATVEKGLYPCVKFWEVSTGRCLETLSLLKFPKKNSKTVFHVKDFIFSPDGHYVALLGVCDPFKGKQKILIYDWKINLLVAAHNIDQSHSTVNDNPFCALKIEWNSYSESMLSTVGKNIILFWKLDLSAMKKPIKTKKNFNITPYPGKMGSFASGYQTFTTCEFLKNCTVTGTADGNVFFWLTDKLIKVVEAHKGPIFCINHFQITNKNKIPSLFMKEGFITCGSDGIIQFWNVEPIFCKLFSFNLANFLPKNVGVSAIRSFDFKSSRNPKKCIIGLVGGSILEVKIDVGKVIAEMIIQNEESELLKKKKMFQYREIVQSPYSASNSSNFGSNTTPDWQNGAESLTNITNLFFQEHCIYQTFLPTSFFNSVLEKPPSDSVLIDTFQNEDLFCSIASDGSLKTWDLLQKKMIQQIQLPAYFGKPTCVSVISFVVDPSELNNLNTAREENEENEHLQTSDDNLSRRKTLLAVGFSTGSIFIFRALKGKIPTWFEPNPFTIRKEWDKEVLAIKFSPNGAMMAVITKDSISFEDKEAIVWICSRQTNYFPMGFCRCPINLEGMPDKFNVTNDSVFGHFLVKPSLDWDTNSKYLRISVLLSQKRLKNLRVSTALKQFLEKRCYWVFKVQENSRENDIVFANSLSSTARKLREKFRKKFDILLKNSSNRNKSHKKQKLFGQEVDEEAENSEDNSDSSSSNDENEEKQAKFSLSKTVPVKATPKISNEQQFFNEKGKTATLVPISNLPSPSKKKKHIIWDDWTTFNDFEFIENISQISSIYDQIFFAFMDKNFQFLKQLSANLGHNLSFFENNDFYSSLDSLFHLFGLNTIQASHSNDLIALGNNGGEIRIFQFPLKMQDGKTPFFFSHYFGLTNSDKSNTILNEEQELLVETQKGKEKDEKDSQEMKLRLLDWFIDSSLLPKTAFLSFKSVSDPVEQVRFSKDDNFLVSTFTSRLLVQWKLKP